MFSTGHKGCATDFIIPIKPSLPELLSFHQPTPWLCVGEAIGFLSGLLSGGIEALMRRNHELAVVARRMLCERLPFHPLCPEQMLGAMAAFILPDHASLQPEPFATPTSPQLGNVLLKQFGIEVPVYYWPNPPQALLRISAQAYNGLDHYRRLAEALESLDSGWHTR